MDGEQKSKKPIKIIAIVVVVLIIVLALVWLTNNKQDSGSQVNVQEQEETLPGDIVPDEERNIDAVVDDFKEEVPVDIAVPEVNEELDEELAKTIAVPKVVSAAAPGSDSQFRSFDIVGNEGIFTPSTIIVNEGDTVHIDFTAQDAGYDIKFPSYGMKQVAKVGQTKILEFQANQPGKFLYYCESCGGETSPATGYIIVVAQE